MNNYLTLITKFATFLQNHGKQPATIESYCRDAEAFCSYLQGNSVPFSELQPQTLGHYQAHLAHTCHDKPNSIRRSIIGIRQFFRFLQSEQVITASPFDQVPLPPRHEELPPRLEPKEIESLIASALEKSPSPKAERDAAICALLAYEGLKASELTRLKWTDFLGSEALPTLRVDPGSSQRSPRLLLLQRNTAQHINHYYQVLREWDHPFWNSPRNKNMMFIGFKGRHHLSPLPYLTRHGLKFMLYELGAKLAIPHLTTEHLRHYAINFLLGQGYSSEQVMNHLGLRRLGNIAKYRAMVDEGECK